MDPEVQYGQRGRAAGEPDSPGGHCGRTDAVIEATADEAERGYDVGEILRRRSPGRPAMGSGASSVESVRLDPELKRDLLLRAAAERTSVSQIIRDAVRQYLRAG